MAALASRARGNARPTGFLDRDGKPMGWVTTAHAAADIRSQELLNFRPNMYSPDGAYLPERGRIVSRIHDLARNDGWTSSTLQRYVDQAIGASFRLNYQPDHVALGITFDEAMAFKTHVESEFRQYAMDPRCFVDSAERLNWPALVGTAFRHRMRDGEALAVMDWLDRPWFAYKTAVRLVSPERLSNPNDAPNTDTLRGGVELNARGAPTKFWFRVKHPADQYFGASDSFRWEAVDRRTPWGRPIVVHAFEPEDCDQTRGKSPFAAIVEKVFMTNRYAKAEMQAAVINAILAAYLETPMDAESMAEALSETDAYQTNRLAFHEQNAITLNGSRLPVLYPGEKIVPLDATRPNANYPEFEKRALRYYAAATGQSYEQLAADYSDTNYSSLRAGLMEFWKFLTARRDHFGAGFCTPIFSAWMEEAVDNGRVTLPKDAPKFWQAYAAYNNCRWNGPGRGTVDPVKEADGAKIRIETGTSNEIDEAAELGSDYINNLNQKAYAVSLRKERKLPEPGAREPKDTDRDTESSNRDDEDDDEDAAPKSRRAGRLTVPNVSAHA